MTDKPSAVNADGISEPFAVESVPWQEWSEGSRYGSRFRYLSAFGGASHVGVAMEELAPGMESSLNHYHMLEEEQALIVAGEMTLKLGDKTYLLKTGDYVCFPAGQKAGHSFYNHSSEPCRFLIIGEKNPHDVIVYPETGRVSVRLTGEGYDKSATMEYWQGADTERKG